MIRRPPRSTLDRSSAASDVYKRQDLECSNQEKYSIQLVKKEIEEINPEYCIVLTNTAWWLPFHKELNATKIACENLPSEILFFEQYNNTKIIVTTRPYPGGSGEGHVKQILQLIRG